LQICQAESKFYGPLTLFGRQPSFDDDASPGSKGSDEGKSKDATPSADSAAIEAASRAYAAPEVAIGQFLPFLQDLANFVRRVGRLCVNMVHQIACLYHERQKLYQTTFKDVRMNSVFESIGVLLRIIVTVDLLVAENEFLAEHWLGFKRMVKFVRTDSTKFNIDAAKMRTFESMLLAIDRDLIAGSCLEVVLNQDFGLIVDGNTAQAQALVAGNRVLFDEFNDYIRSTLETMETGLGDASETFPRTRVVELHAVYVLFRRLFRASSKPDVKLFRRIWDLQRKVPFVQLYARSVFFPAEFLWALAPLKDAESYLQPPNRADELQKFRREYVTRIDESLSRRTQELYMQLSVWMVRFESELMDSRSKQLSSIASVLNARAKLVLSGSLLANSIHNLLVTAVLGHVHAQLPFRKDTLRSLCVLVESLKALQATFHRRSTLLAENISHLIGQAQFTLKRIFAPMKAKLELAQRPDESKLDVLAAVTLTLDLLSSAATSERMTVLASTLCVIQNSPLLKDTEKDEIKYQTWKINQLAQLQPRLRSLFDTSFLYFTIDLIPLFIRDMYDHPEQIHRLPYLLASLRDSAPMLMSMRRWFDSQPAGAITFASSAQPPAPALGALPYFECFQREVARMLDVELVNPLCHEVETDLRLHIHSVALQQESLRNKKLKHLTTLLQLKPFRLFSTLVDLRSRVAHHLDVSFYNLNTIALHDWKIYAEMRNLASEKFGLHMMEAHLPGHSHYSEGLDVLEIMRNIHIFVTKYNYNLNTQVFLERALDQKHLNTIDIHHIANSIRTHGIGITNTTVNFTYQFLVNKFLIFSEFLYDDHIKSRLMKDIRFFRERKDDLEQRYPYDRAEKFNKDIRKLGVSEDGRTYLDQFRQLITEIGNALGYVRMVRSGVLNYVSNAIKFVPDLEDIISFEKNAEGLSSETVAAGKNLDQVLANLSKNSASGTDYFKILVAVFVDVLAGSDQQHLKNFYAIIPPMTLNFVEKIMEQKERLGKKTKGLEAAFTDDGFALGLAYVLKLLNQNHAFDALHWFDSVTLRLRGERQKLAELAKSKNDEDKQTLQLSLTRLNNLQAEFEMLFYSFSGARVFFREADAKKKEAAADAAAAPVSDTPANSAPVPPANSAPVGPPVPPVGPSVPGAFVATPAGPPLAPMGPPPPMMPASMGPPIMPASMMPPFMPPPMMPPFMPGPPPPGPGAFVAPPAGPPLALMGPPLA
jgi:WASH complex subunit 7